VKPTVLCLWALATVSAGCFTLNKGLQDQEEALPRAAMVAEPPPPVKPEEVQEANDREALRRLKKEIAFDEDAARHRTPIQETAEPE
jgi:hypothetical protein